MILLTGFGPFREVTDNPSARLVKALDGARIADHDVSSLVLPVSWTTALPTVIAAARRCQPALVVGFGVATAREVLQVEAVGRREARGPDAHGLSAPALLGPAEVPSTVDVARMADCLGGTVSHDAGHYLCNAWLHQTAAALPCPVAFVHIPPAGVAPDRIRAGLACYVRGPAS